MLAELFIIISQSVMTLHITLVMRASKPEVILLWYRKPVKGSEAVRT